MFSQFPKFRFTLNKAANLDSIKVFVKDLQSVATITPEKFGETEIKLAFRIHQIDKDWSYTSSSLKRNFKFESFKQAFVFMNTISSISDDMQHYPKWVNIYNKISVEISTPDVRGVSIKDVLLAYIMDYVAKDVEQQNIEHISQPSKIVAGTLIQNWNVDYSKPEYVEIIKMKIRDL